MINNKLIVFDLDDTLYDEHQYVESGLNAVAYYLATIYKFRKEKTFSDLMEIFMLNGRGKVFNIFFENNNILLNNLLTEKLINIYRYEQDYNINLFYGIKSLLTILKKRGLNIAILTDTNWRVQKNKIQTLKLNRMVDKIYYSHKEGTKKPDIKLYNLILSEFCINACNSYWVGDDPRCDFFTPNSLGGVTIRTKMGRLKDMLAITDYNAKYSVSKINELKKLLINIL